MTKTLMMRVESMKQLAELLENGGSWELCCGYSIHENDPFINLTEELNYV